MKWTPESPDAVVAFGNPWHGTMLDSTLTLPNGALLAGQRGSGGDHHLVEFADLPAPPAPTADETAAGMSWRAYAILQGADRRYSPTSPIGFGVGVWPWRAPDGAVWALRIVWAEAAHDAWSGLQHFSVEARRFGVIGGAESAWQTVAEHELAVPAAYAGWHKPANPLRLTHAATGGQTRINLYCRPLVGTPIGDAGTLVDSGVQLLAVLGVEVSGGDEDTPPAAACTTARYPSGANAAAYFSSVETASLGDSGVPVAGTWDAGTGTFGAYYENTVETRSKLFGVVIDPAGVEVDMLAEQARTTLYELTSAMPENPAAGGWSWRRTQTDRYSLRDWQFGLQSRTDDHTPVAGVANEWTVATAYGNDMVAAGPSQQASLLFKLCTCHVLVALAFVSQTNPALNVYKGFAAAPDGGHVGMDNFNASAGYAAWNPKTGALIPSAAYF